MDECCGFQLDRGMTPDGCADASAQATPPRGRHLYFTGLMESIGSLDGTITGLSEVRQTRGGAVRVVARVMVRVTSVRGNV